MGARLRFCRRELRSPRNAPRSSRDRSARFGRRRNGRRGLALGVPRRRGWNRTVSRDRADPWHEHLQLRPARSARGARRGGGCTRGAARHAAVGTGDAEVVDGTLMQAGPLEHLARLAIDGDRDALEELVKALQSDVYGLAVRMLWNREDAEDAAQEILVRTVT